MYGTCDQSGLIKLIKETTWFSHMRVEEESYNSTGSYRRFVFVYLTIMSWSRHMQLGSLESCLSLSPSLSFSLSWTEFELDLQTCPCIFDIIYSLYLTI